LLTDLNQNCDPTMLFSHILPCVISRDPRTLHVDPSLDGDCFTSHAQSKLPRFLSELPMPSNAFSDLFTQLTLMNATVFAQSTVVDGRFLVADPF
jgi:hypothetical protein